MKKKQKRSTWVTTMLVIGLLGSLGFIAIHKLLQTDTLPFKYVKIFTPAKYTQPLQLREIVKQNIEGGFFSLRKNKLHNSLLAQPWVSQIELRREWPNALTIVIYEQQPVAQWGDNGVINQDGNIFFPDPKTIPKELPILSGPETKKNLMLKEFRVLNGMVAPIGIRIVQMKLSDRLAWRVKLSDGIDVVIGQYALEQRFDRFVKLFSKIIGDRGDKVVQVDLRYPNGLAIQWRSNS